MDILRLKRGNASQDRPVSAELSWNGESLGRLEMPFAAWIKVKRLLEKGIEADAREQSLLGVKLRIEGGLGQHEAAPLDASSTVPEPDFDLAEVLAAESYATAQPKPVPGGIRIGAKGDK